MIPDIQIGFQRATYNFPEPQIETDIFGQVFIEKQNGRITEQTFPVVFEVSMATPNPTILSASLSTIVGGVVINNDYVVDTPDRVSIIREFLPGDQTLEFSFTLFPDDFPEGTEAFQASAQPSEDPIDPDFLAPSAGVLFASTFIIIEDDDGSYIAPCTCSSIRPTNASRHVMLWSLESIKQPGLMARNDRGAKILAIIQRCTLLRGCFVHQLFIWDLGAWPLYLHGLREVPLLKYNTQC